MSRAEHNEMVQAFPSNRTNETLRLGVLPWAAGSRENLLYSERLNAATKCGAINAVTIAEEISRCIRLSEGFHDLLRRPFSRRMFRYVEVKHFPPFVL